ncbi:hypothetical protein [Nitrosophilus kaiyonis]|uniref:hypothetical protein n=1 Tax=Nitrosophilus kaiyonis TaxID=2930200 RepID=UPI00248FCB67|nr:hypothetical protein [Nitrosophilus kaiyonis]
MLRFLKLILFLAILTGSINASTKYFAVSFGNGGFTSYKVIDNICYGYLIKIKNKKDVMKVLNRALTASIQKVRKVYSKKADGYINIRFKWGNYEKGVILYQVCGDVVKSSKK